MTRMIRAILSDTSEILSLQSCPLQPPGNNKKIPKDALLALSGIEDR